MHGCDSDWTDSEPKFVVKENGRKLLLLLLEEEDVAKFLV
jgi:hypothetical protein